MILFKQEYILLKLENFHSLEEMDSNNNKLARMNRKMILMRKRQRRDNTILPGKSCAHD